MIDSLEDFEESYEMYEAKDCKGRTPFHYAALYKNVDLIINLSQSSNPLLKDSLGLSVLDVAILSGEIRSVQIITTELNWTAYTETDCVRAMKCAFYSGNIEIIDFIIEEHHISLDLLDKTDNSNTLHWAIDSPTLDISYLLASEKVRNLINQGDKSKRTPLHLAAKIDGPRGSELCETLLEYNADPLVTDSKYLTPFHYAATANGASLDTLLRKTEGKIKKPNFGKMESRFVKMPCLHVAISRSKEESFHILLNQIGNEFDPNVVDKHRVGLLVHFIIINTILILILEYCIILLCKIWIKRII